MSVIPQVYNQGTGLIGSTTEGNALPDTVNDLIVENSLTVLGDSSFAGEVTINNDLIVNGTTTTEALAVNGNTTTGNLTIEGKINGDVVIGDTTDTDNGTLEVNSIVNTNSSTQVFQIKESEMSFKIDYPGVIDIEPRVELSISGVNANAKITLEISNTEFRQGIEITQNDFIIRNVNFQNEPLKVQAPSGGFWSFPSTPPPGGTPSILRGTGQGNGSQADPRTTVWS